MFDKLRALYERLWLVAQQALACWMFIAAVILGLDKDTVLLGCAAAVVAVFLRVTAGWHLNSRT